MTNAKTIRIYLDVDGVLNADLSGSKDHWQKGAVGMASAEGYKYKITWAPELIRRLRALEGVEIVWCTTWRDDATRELAELLDFGHDFRVIHPTEDPTAPTPRIGSINWKVPAIKRDLEENPVDGFIHIDDEIIGVWEWGNLVPLLGGLALSPHPLYGITPKMMAAIETYVKKVSFVPDPADE